MYPKIKGFITLMRIFMMLMTKLLRTSKHFLIDLFW